MGTLDGGIEQDLAAVIVQAQAKLDVLDAGLAVGLGIKAPQRQEALAAHGPAASPEGAGWPRLACVGVVVEKVPEAAHHAGSRRSIVVTAEKGLQARIHAEVPPHPLHSVWMELHIRIHKQQNFAAGLGGGVVAGGGRTTALAGVEHRGSAGLEPGGQLREGAIKHHQQLIVGRQARDGCLQATRKWLAPGDGRHHQADSGGGCWWILLGSHVGRLVELVQVGFRLGSGWRIGLALLALPEGGIGPACR